MTITPKQAGEFTSEEKRTLRNLETNIDRTLREGFKNSFNRVTYSWLNYSGQYDSGVAVTGKVTTEIIRMYRKAGWNVKYESDQRDGDYLEFTPRGGRN